MGEKDEILHREFKETLRDHELRIRKLEDITHELKYQLMNIGKSQADLKAIVLDINREQSKHLEALMSNIIKLTNNAVNKHSEIKLLDRKELWAIVALIIGALISMVTKGGL